MAVNHCARCFTPPSTLSLSSSLVHRHPPMDRSNSLCQLSAFLPTLTPLQAASLRLFSLLILQVLCCHSFCHSSTQPSPPPPPRHNTVHLLLLFGISLPKPTHSHSFHYHLSADGSHSAYISGCKKAHYNFQ